MGFYPVPPRTGTSTLQCTFRRRKAKNILAAFQDRQIKISLLFHGERVAVGFLVSSIGLSNQTDSIRASTSILSRRLCRYLVQVSSQLSYTPHRISQRESSFILVMVANIRPSLDYATLDSILFEPLSEAAPGSEG